MRTTLQIDDDVLEEARELAVSYGRSLGAVISDLARRSLRPTPLDREGGFPIFAVAPDAPMITANDVARALDEE